MMQGGEQAAGKVSHSRRDWEEDGRAKYPEESRNTETPPTGGDVRQQ